MEEKKKEAEEEERGERLVLKRENRGESSTQKPTRRKELSAEAQTWGGRSDQGKMGRSGSFRGNKSE